jgi:hypothetical protein
MLLLYPRSTVQVSFYGVCQQVKNSSRDTLVYVPVDSREAWVGFDSRKPFIKVTPCAK